MVLTSMAKIIWLLCMIVSVSATHQFALTPDYVPSKCSYLCDDSANMTTSPWPACCPGCGDSRCPGLRSLRVKATNATELLGTVDVALNDGTSASLPALADLTIRRNFITSALLDALSLDGEVQKFSGIDIHSMEVFGRNVTIETFVLLSVGIGIDDRLLNDKIFEIIPKEKSENCGLVTADLILGLSFLQDAGALAINQAIFTT